MASDDQAQAKIDQARLKKATEELRKYFNHDPSFWVVGGLAVGAGGNALVEVHQAFPNGYVRPLVVKRALEEDGSGGLTSERAKCLEREIEALKLLQGAEHIVQRVVLNPDPLQKPLVPTGKKGLPGPYLVMEKLPLGTLGAFLKNYQKAPYPLPNRVLWRFFLGLIRACVGMAWPPRRPDNSPTTKEVPGPGEKTELMIHLDINLSNIMLDLPDRNDPEHNITPKLKLIDFGRSRLHGGIDSVTKEDVGYQENVYSIGKIMLALIFKDPGIAITQTSDVQLQFESGSAPTTAKVRVGWTGRTEPLDVIPGLDRDLHVLVLLCLAARPSERPSLETLLAQVEPRLGRDAAFYRAQGARHHDREADEFVANLMDRILFNPGVPLPPYT